VLDRIVLVQDVALNSKTQVVLSVIQLFKVKLQYTLIALLQANSHTNQVHQVKSKLLQFAGAHTVHL
jgi:hypothetical protein